MRKPIPQKPKKPNLARARRLGGKIFTPVGEGGEGRVWHVREEGKRRGIAVKRYFHKIAIRKEIAERLEERDFIARQIAHLLFPDNFPRPIAHTIQGMRVRRYSKYHPPSPELRRIQRARIRTGRVLKSAEHETLTGRISHLSIVTLRSKFLTAGIRVEDGVYNIDVHTPSKPIFYELDAFSAKDVLRYVETHRLTPKIKKRILELVAEYTRLQALQ